jgi:hypothetical protein
VGDSSEEEEGQGSNPSAAAAAVAASKTSRGARLHALAVSSCGAMKHVLRGDDGESVDEEATLTVAVAC